MPVQGKENEQQYGEGPKGGPSVTQQRQRNTYDGHQSHCHTNVYEQMHKEARCDAISVDSGERFPAGLGIQDYPSNQQDIKGDDDKASQESPFLAHRTEDEVRTLFGDKAVSCLGAVQEPFPEEPAGPYGNHRLVHVVPYAAGVFLHSEQDFDSAPLMLLKNVVESEVRGKNQGGAGRKGNE